MTLTVTATRFGDPRTVLTVDYATEADSAQAEADFKTTSGTITFGPGETHKQIVVELLNDLLIESPEDFRVRLRNPQPTGPGGVQMGTGPTTANVNIDDDDGGTSVIQFTTTEYLGGEGDINAVVTAVRSGGAGFKVSAQYTTTAGTATAGQDYQESTGRVEFESGEYSKAIRVIVFQDTIVEATENFAIALSNPSVNASIGATNNTATVSILDDEGPPVITSPTTASGQRGQPFTYRITATNNPTSYDATGLPTGLAVDSDTGLISGTPNDFGAFQVEISATNSKGTGTATLIISIASGETTIVQFRQDLYTVTDPTTSVTLIVDLARAGGEADTQVTVDYATSDGTAKAGIDYQPQAGTLVFAPGQKQQTIPLRSHHAMNRVPIAPSSSISNPSRGMLGRSRATIVSTHPDLSTKLLNIATRAPVRSGEEVMIAGFIIEGTVPKQIVLRGIGPALTALLVPDAVQDPTLTLLDSNGSQIAFNDNYAQNSAEDEQTLNDNTLAPSDSREAALVATLAPGSYTAVCEVRVTALVLWRSTTSAGLPLVAS